MMENTGVMPLPPAKPMTSPLPLSRQNRPAGRVVSTTSPADSVSVNHVDTTPPSTRLTVTVSSSSTSGDEDSQELASGVTESSAQVVGYVEHHRDRVVGFAPDPPHP